MTSYHIKVGIRHRSQYMRYCGLFTLSMANILYPKGYNTICL